MTLDNLPTAPLANFSEATVTGGYSNSLFMIGPALKAATSTTSPASQRSVSAAWTPATVKLLPPEIFFM